MDDFKNSLESDCATPIKIEGKRRHMGIGRFGSANITFVKKFRWTLGADNLEEHWIKSVVFDFKLQTISFQSFEIVESGKSDISIQRWLEKEINEETMVFTTYDGCGTPLYKYEFSDLDLVHDRINFDYKDSSEAVRSVGVHYNAMQRTFLAVPEGEPPKVSVPKKGFAWKIRVDDDKESFVVKMNSRPQLQIEESEVNFLNGKTWVPGKASWDSLHVTLSKEAEKYLMPMLVNWNKHKLHLDLHPKFYKTGGVLETWTLEDPWVESIKIVGDLYQIEFRYSNVRYENEQTRKSED